MNQKRFALIGIIVGLLFLLSICVGCSDTDPTTGTSDHQIITTKTPVTTVSPSTDTSLSTTKSPVSSLVAPQPSIEPVHYMFSSIKDLHTYVKTGSRDLADYETESSVPLEDFLDIEMISRSSYLAVEAVLGIDETQFHDVCAAFKFDEERIPAIMFYYCLDDVMIDVYSVDSLESDDLIGRYAEVRTTPKDKMTISSYTEKNAVKDGYLLREKTEYDVLYQMKNGVQKAAAFCVEGFFVIIQLTDEGAYPTFVTESKTASLAALFSEDDRVFEEAIARVSAAAQQETKNDAVTQNH